MKKLMPKKESKLRSTRNDKDIQLNIVGVPPTNINVNKTLAGKKNEEHHLYKISIDTTKRNENKSAVYKSPLTHQANKTMGNTNVKAKPTTSKASSKWEHDNLTSKNSKSKGNKKTDVCLTVPDEGHGEIKIVNTSTEGQKEIPSVDNAFGPKSGEQSPQAREYETDVGNKNAYNSSFENNLLQVNETVDNQDHNSDLEKPIRINLLPNWQGFEVDDINNKAPVRNDLQPDNTIIHSPKMLEIVDKELNPAYNKQPLTDHPSFVRRLPGKEGKYYPAKGQYIPTTISRENDKNPILKQFPRNVSGTEKSETSNQYDPLHRQLFPENKALFPTTVATMTESPVRSTTDMTKERQPSEQIKHLQTKFNPKHTNEDQNKLNKSIKPITEDKQLMTDNILTKSLKTPNSVTDKINAARKPSVSHSKQSGESLKHSQLASVENKNKLIKSSLVSTIPKPSFTMTRSSVVQDSSDQSSEVPSIYKKGSPKSLVDSKINNKSIDRTNSLEAPQYALKPAIKEIIVNEDKHNDGTYSIPIIQKGQKYIGNESTSNMKPLQEHDAISFEISQHNYDKPSLLRSDFSQKEPTLAPVISSKRLDSFKGDQSNIVVGQEELPLERKEIIARNRAPSELALGTNCGIEPKPVDERIYATKRVTNENSPSYYDRLGESLDKLKFKHQYGTPNVQIDNHEFPSDTTKKSFHAQSPTFMNGFDNSEMKTEEESMNAPKQVINDKSTHLYEHSDKSLDRGRPKDASEISKASSGKYSFSFDGFEDIPSKEKSKDSFTNVGKELPTINKNVNFDQRNSTSIPTDSVRQTLMSSEKDTKTIPFDKTEDTRKQTMDITSPSFDNYLKKVDRTQDIPKTESDMKGYSFDVPPKKTIDEDNIRYEKPLNKGMSEEKHESDLIHVEKHAVSGKLADEYHETTPPFKYGHTGIMAYPSQVKENDPFLRDSKVRLQKMENDGQHGLPISQLEKGTSNKPVQEGEPFNKAQTPSEKIQPNGNDIADTTLSKMYKLIDDVGQLPPRSEHQHEAINKNIIAYPGQVRKKDPFLYESNASLHKIEQGIQSGLPIHQLENRESTDKSVPTNEGKYFIKDQISSENVQPIDVDMADITLSKIYQLIDDVRKVDIRSESESENTELVPSEDTKINGSPFVGKHQHGEKRKKSVLAEPGSHKLRRKDPFGQGTQDQMVFLGKIPNTTYNVFFSPDSARETKNDKEKMDQKQVSKKTPKHKKHGKHKVKNSPKGLIIFVNKKTAEASHNPFRGAGEQRLVMSAAVPAEANLPKDKTNQIHSGSTKYPLQQQETSKEKQVNLQSDLYNYNVQTPKLRMSVDDNNDKNISVEKSPNGTKITEKYPCGCWRIISSDRDHEITGEEIINAFCTMGDKCCVSLPELQKTLRVIPYQSSNTEYSGTSLYVDDANFDVFKKIEVFADGIVSRKPIKDKPPPPTMRGANYTGSVNIKSNKLNATCNVYLDQNLKNYLLDNWEDFRGMLKNS